MENFHQDELQTWFSNVSISRLVQNASPKRMLPPSSAAAAGDSNSCPEDIAMESCTKLKIGQVFSSQDGEYGHVFQDKAEDEVELLKCQLCNVTKEPVDFWDHVTKIHGVQKEDYNLIERNMQHSTQDAVSCEVSLTTPNDKAEEAGEVGDPEKGLYIKDVRKIFGFFDPLPPLSEFWLDL